MHAYMVLLLISKEKRPGFNQRGRDTSQSGKNACDTRKVAAGSLEGKKKYISLGPMMQVLVPNLPPEIPHLYIQGHGALGALPQYPQ